MGPVRTSDARNRTKWIVPTAIAACILLAALALGAFACGGGDTTTTLGPQPDETSTTAAPDEVSSTDTTAGEDETTTSVTEEETSSTDTSTTEGETTTTEKLTSNAEQRLDNGDIKAMGFITAVGVKDGKRFITIDYALMLTGQEAVDAAVKNGDLAAGEDLPNDYYISNTNHELRTFEVSDTAKITTSSWQDEQNKSITWDVFVSFWSATPPDEQAGFLVDSPWWIERNGQTVVKIDEQYLP